MTIDPKRWEVVRCDGPDEATVELWDRTLEPGGLVMEVIERDDGALFLVGHAEAPLDVVTEFLDLARAWFTEAANDREFR